MAPGTRSRGIYAIHGWVLVGLSLVASASLGVLVGRGTFEGNGIVAETALVGLAGSVGGMAAILATLGLARTLSPSREPEVDAQDVEELVTAAELRVEHAEAEASAAVSEVRRETLAALAGLRHDLRAQRSAFSAYVEAHQRMHRMETPRTNVPDASSEVDVDDVVAAMASEAQALPESPRAFYAGGDERPVDEVPGIDESSAIRLHEHGIHTTAQLCALDAEDVARRLRVWPNLVRHWQATAELMALHGLAPKDAQALHAAGVDLRDLSRSQPEDVARMLHVGPDDPRTRAWIDEARRLVSK